LRVSTSKSKKKGKPKKGKQSDSKPKGSVKEVARAVDIDHILESLSISKDELTSDMSSTAKKYKALSIDPQNLKVSNEIRRLFGRLDNVLEDPEEAVQRRKTGRRGEGAMRNRNIHMGSLTSLALKRNLFIVGKEDWPRATGSGLTMVVENQKDDDKTTFSYKHDAAYQDVQEQFFDAVESMDADRLVLMLRNNRK